LNGAETEHHCSEAGGPHQSHYWSYLKKLNLSCQVEEWQQS
jgi:hypothetical protein